MNNKSFIQAITLFLGLVIAIFMGINWHMALAAWIAPVLLLKFTRNTRVWGFIVFFLLLILVGAISRSALVLVKIPLLFILTGISYSITFALPFLIDRLLYKRYCGFRCTYIFPAAVVLIEFLVTKAIGSWGVFAHTQYPFIEFTQTASLFGLFAISFMVAWFASVINWLIENNFGKNFLRKGVLIYSSILLLILVYGEVRLTFFSPDSQTVRVAGITGEVDVVKLFDSEQETLFGYAEGKINEIPDRIFTNEKLVLNQVKHTQLAAEAGAKVIAWSEISLILNIEQVDLLKSRIKQICSENSCFVLMAYMEAAGVPDKKPFNNRSVLMTPDGTIAWEYSKSNLHPEGEAPIINPGDSKIPFVDTPYGRLGSVICYDMDFPDLLRQAGKNHIDIMLVPAFDWKEITPFHAYMASFETIQNGFSLLRPNGTGLSAAYDNHGKLVAQSDTFTSECKIMYADLPTKSFTTFYSLIGYVFPYLAMIYLILIVTKKIVTKIQLITGKRKITAE